MVAKEGGGAYENKRCISRMEKPFVNVSDALQLMLAFGALLVSIVRLIVELTKNDTKK